MNKVKEENMTMFPEGGVQRRRDRQTDGQMQVR